MYGPNEYHKGGQKSVVAHIFPQVKANETVKLFKSYHPDYRDGWQLRDFVWVGDCVDVVLWLLEHPEVSPPFMKWRMGRVVFLFLLFWGISAVAPLSDKNMTIVLSLRR